MGDGGEYRDSPIIQGCLRASSGLRRLVGSQHKHLRMKLTNSGFCTLCITDSRLLVAGCLMNPLLFGDILGRLLEWKNILRRLAAIIRLIGGTPSISIMHCNCSVSFSPGNIGFPVNSSTNIHPNDHMSIGSPYSRPIRCN